jgi:iduronate 2-sulfatase
MLLGLRPDRTGILNNVKSWRETVGDRITLPRLFRDNGYHTVGLGKVFHGGDKHDDPKAWDERYEYKPTEKGRRGKGRNLTGGTVKWCQWLAAEGDDEDQPDGQLAVKTIEMLRQQSTEPFFMAVGFHKPHDPFNAPKKYFDMYELEQLQPPAVPEGIETMEKYAIGSGWKAAFDKFSLQDKREFMRAYYACVTFTDAQIGKVLDELDRQRLWENTTVFFVGDHGYELGEHEWWNKNVLFEDSARVPMIAAVPGLTRPGTRCKAFVEMVDFYPTFADICGLRMPEDLDGVSFRPLLSEPEQKWKVGAFTQVIRGDVTGKSIRTERWRYTQWRRGDKVVWEELYDHESNPQEYRNLADKKRYEEYVNELGALLRNNSMRDKSR